MTRALIGEAHKAVLQAEHLFTVLYPFTHNAKLLLAILASLHKANDRALAYMIEQNKIEKGTWEERLGWLLQHGTQKGVPQDVIDTIADLDKIMQLQKDCPIEFVRKDKFVLCTDTYDVRTISNREITHYLAKTKIFIEKIISTPAL